jgi:hypothetical protein
MTNPFTNAYDMAAMTAAINKLPNLYGRLNEMNLFPFSPINTTSVMVEQRNGTLNIVRSRPRGAAPDKSTADKRQLRSFAVPHLPVEDVLLPDDYQNVRAFGSDNAMESQASIMANKLQRMRNILDQTLEYLRMGALKGIILDADATTLYNLYNEFNIPSTTTAGTVGSWLTVEFDLDDEDEDVITHCLNVKRHIEMNLRGERMTGVRGLCDSVFFDALTTHPKVTAAYQRWQDGRALFSDNRKGFTFGEITFEEYGATWTDHDGTARAAIAASHCHFFPEGTGDTFSTICAPGNFIETANTMGQPYYARQEERKLGQGIDLWAESNILPLCRRPEVLVHGNA